MLHFRLILLIVITLFSVAVFGQNKNILGLEKELLLANEDIEAIALIKDHFALKDSLYYFKLDIMNSFDSDLSQKEKIKIFEQEYSTNSDYIELKDAVKSALELKNTFLKSSYPNRFRKIKSSNAATASKRSKKIKAQKVKFN